MKSIDTFNSKRHRYITSVKKEDGWIVIHGRIGRRNYLYHSLKEATTKYNKECKKHLDK